jgi:hypothetical protein
VGVIVDPTNGGNDRIQKFLFLLYFISHIHIFGRTLPMGYRSKLETNDSNFRNLFFLPQFIPYSKLLFA